LHAVYPDIPQSPGRYLQGFGGDTMNCAIATARLGARVAFVYDSNLRLRLWPRVRAREVITATLSQADYFLLSMEDAEALCGLRDADAIVDWCHRAGAGVVALKLGADGVIGSAYDDRIRHRRTLTQA
jgi:2-dehydro-3-deoxygluconokinase